MIEHVRSLSLELMLDLEHASISGVEVMEQYNKVHEQAGSAVAPFVFVSAMGLEHAVEAWRELAFREVGPNLAPPASPQGTRTTSAVRGMLAPFHVQSHPHSVCEGCSMWSVAESARDPPSPRVGSQSQRYTSRRPRRAHTL